MTIPDLVALAPLDWTTYACNCPCHPCSNQATHIVHIHQLHRCEEPGLDFGNRVELRCYECTLRLIAEVAYRLDKLNQFGIAACASCGAPIVTVGDVVRSWEELA